jgi:hypothetical protein
VTIELDSKTARRQEGARGFAMVWIEAMIGIDLDKRVELLLLLAERADLRGLVYYRLDKLAERMGCPKSTAWRAMQQLIEKDVLRRVERGVVQVNPNIVWQGPIADRSTAMIRWHNAIDAQPFDGERKYSA